MENIERSKTGTQTMTWDSAWAQHQPKPKEPEIKQSGQEKPNQDQADAKKTTPVPQKPTTSPGNQAERREPRPSGRQENHPDATEANHKPRQPGRKTRTQTRRTPENRGGPEPEPGTTALFIIAFT
jgi:hypothetical protein